MFVHWLSSLYVTNPDAVWVVSTVNGVGRGMGVLDGVVIVVAKGAVLGVNLGRPVVPIGTFFLSCARAKHFGEDLSAICRPNGCTVVSVVVVVVVVGGGVCNRSQMRTSKCTCLIFGVNIGLEPG